MMSVNPVPDKSLVVYYSLGGNTKGIVNEIIKYMDGIGELYEILPLHVKPDLSTLDIEQYKYVFLGSSTYGKGKTPKLVLDFLRHILNFNEFKLPTFSFFCTGDTQWPTYCRAVDEMSYHLSKKTQVKTILKIEQYPISDKQIRNIHEFVKASLGR
jgi:flavodoxin I